MDSPVLELLVGSVVFGCGGLSIFVRTFSRAYSDWPSLIVVEEELE